MPVEKKTAPTPSGEEFDLNTPGFHVVRADDVYLGTYPEANDAECFIEQQCVPQNIKASIVEGKEAAVEEPQG